MHDFIDNKAKVSYNNTCNRCTAMWHLIGFVCFSLSREGPASKSPVPLGKSLAKISPATHPICAKLARGLHSGNTLQWGSQKPKTGIRWVLEFSTPLAIRVYEWVEIGLPDHQLRASPPCNPYIWVGWNMAITTSSPHVGLAIRVCEWVESWNPDLLLFRQKVPK